MFVFVMAGSGIWIPYFCYFSQFFGSFDDLSPYAKRETEKKKGSEMM